MLCDYVVLGDVSRVENHVGAKCHVRYYADEHVEEAPVVIPLGIVVLVVLAEVVVAAVVVRVVDVDD